jgi:acyl carrier protein
MTPATRLLAIITAHFGAIETPETDVLDALFVRDLRPDSLDAIELAMLIEDEFSIELSDADMDLLYAGSTTLRHVLLLVEAKLGAFAA